MERGAGRTRRRALRALPALAAGALLVGCGEADARGGWAGTVDTLASGAVGVSNPAGGVWEDGEEWSLVEELRLGSLEGEGPELFGRVGDVEVDGGGRIYVLDTQASEVRVFGPGGDHIATFGRPGEGPGELKQPRGLELGPDGDVWIVDLGNQRYTVIDSAGKLVEERRRFTGGNVSPWPGIILSDGRVIDVDLAFVDGSPTWTHTLHSPEGELLDTVPLPVYEGPTFRHTSETSRVAADVPFSPQLRLAWDPLGGIWAGVPEDYRVVHTDLGGDTTLIVERAYEPVPVTRAEKDAAIENMEWFTNQGGRIDRSRISDEHPAYQSLHADRKGHLWVVPTLPREEEATPETLDTPRPAVFDVFDPEGRYLGRIHGDVPVLRPLITGSHVYAITVDDLGVQYVVRLRIEGR